MKKDWKELKQFDVKLDVKIKNKRKQKISKICKNEKNGEIIKLLSTLRMCNR